MLRNSAVIVALVFAVSSDAVAQRRATAKLDWLAGCWRQNTSDGIVEEQWTQPGGQMILGVGRTMRGDTTASFELMRIFGRRNLLIFEARPNGGKAVEFVSSNLTPRVLDFRNSKNDFPQRVVYRYISADTLSAFIEGPAPRDLSARGGPRAKPIRIDYAYHRVSCEPDRGETNP